MKRQPHRVAFRAGHVDRNVGIIYRADRKTLLFISFHVQINQMGSFVPLPAPTTAPPPTTLKPSVSATDNLVHKIAEGPSVSFLFYC